MVKIKKEWLYEITEAHAPSMHAALDELCEKAGIKKPTLCGVDPAKIKKPLTRFEIEHNAFAAMGEKGSWYHVVVGDKLREALGMANHSSSITDELKGVLAHEIGHLKHDSNEIVYKAIRYSPCTGFAVGMGGLMFYDYLKHREQQARAAGKPEAEINDEIRTLWRESDHSSASASEPFDPLLRMGKYLAGGLLGFAIGTLAYKILNQRIEFRADRVSAELLSDGKPLANAFRMMKGHGDGAFTEMLKKHPEALTELIEPEKIYNTFLSMFSHPRDIERIARLEEFSFNHVSSAAQR